MSHSITICLGDACIAAGNRDHLEMVESYLAGNHVRADVVCEACSCSGACSAAPRVVMNGVSYTQINTASLLDLLEYYYSAETVV